VFAEFLLDEAVLDELRAATASGEKYLRWFVRRRQASSLRPAKKHHVTLKTASFRMPRNDAD